MAKSDEKNKALLLRKQGESIKTIARKVRVSKSTVSLWCRDIVLTREQIEKLEEAKRRGSYAGRIKGARTQYTRRLRITKELEAEGSGLLGDLSVRDIFVLGIGLYWGEGAKYGSQVSITNSDPAIIAFAIKWFCEVWDIPSDRFKFHILINEAHRDRLDEVERFWRKIVRIPNPNFGKTVLIKAKNKKSYANFRSHFGTLQIRIHKPAEIHHKIMGILQKIGSSGVLKSRGSSVG